MTPHDHREYVEGCYRCELGRDEVEAMTPAARVCATCGAPVVVKDTPAPGSTWRSYCDDCVARQIEKRYGFKR